MPCCDVLSCKYEHWLDTRLVTQGKQQASSSQATPIRTQGVQAVSFRRRTWTVSRSCSLMSSSPSTNASTFVMCACGSASSERSTSRWSPAATPASVRISPRRAGSSFASSCTSVNPLTQARQQPAEGGNMRCGSKAGQRPQREHGGARQGSELRVKQPPASNAQQCTTMHVLCRWATARPAAPRATGPRGTWQLEHDISRPASLFSMQPAAPRATGSCGPCPAPSACPPRSLGAAAARTRPRRPCPFSSSSRPGSQRVPRA